MTVEVTTRVAALDRLRGLIIVLMAVDHAAFFVVRTHPAETWAAPPRYYADVTAFLTRWLTHLCAPGFFLLLGIGVVLFANSRRAAGWSEGRISRHLALRGFVLLVVQHVIENPACVTGIAVCRRAVLLVHGVCRRQSVPVGVHQLVPDDDIPAQGRRQGVGHPGAPECPRVAIR